MAAQWEDEEALLGSIGLRAVGDDLAPLRAAATRVARHIASHQLGVVGFVPTDALVATPAVLIHLGLALVELTGATVAVVDANVRYPALAALSTGASRHNDESVFSTRWLRGSLALLSPTKVERAGDVLPQLARLLGEGADLFKHVLVDLTGFELLGEHAAAAASMEAVVLVGRAHRSRERELLALAQSMPPERFLGVMLVG
ncbi:MAG: hypothetical protein KBG15_13370 [Kofleriaceae bacterium]|nr:hypothetical protein [Kofleriaceae bacterium]